MVQGIGHRLLLALQKQTSRVIYFSEAKNISLNTAVHEVRKSFKRIRALLLFCQSSEGEYVYSISQQLSEFGKNISAFRNSWVNILVLDRISQINPHIPERKMKLLKERFMERNRQLQQQDIVDKKTGTTIRKFMEEFEVGMPANLKVAGEQFVKEQLNLSFQSSYEIFQDENIWNEAEKLHELRKKLKTLYYQTSFLKFSHAKFFKPKSDQLDIITEQLGEDHDLYVFLDEIKKTEYGLNFTEISIVENKINHLRVLNSNKCRPRLRQLFSESPESFAQKITAIF
ncbi:CHAD domain-containing protein [Prolixibacteraceae bacterium Z1-6]|uniref:CHAD domain-containing protein n=1 Tax=Draconibacterium aestuarii TaxID=2998507 RepID=A0A9X3J9D4_9BACT|nr:CHAD domain-containing protein [Prolixibacteraceae bacterium Z1-6]